MTAILSTLAFENISINKLQIVLHREGDQIVFEKLPFLLVVFVFVFRAASFREHVKEIINRLFSDFSFDILSL